MENSHRVRESGTENAKRIVVTVVSWASAISKTPNASQPSSGETSASTSTSRSAAFAYVWGPRCHGNFHYNRSVMVEVDKWHR